VQDVQPIPIWGGFNPVLNPDLPSVSKNGYCPLIEGSSTELSTVYTVMKHAQKICASLGQLDTVITFDLAIYAKAKQIQMKFPEEFSDSHSPWWIPHSASWQEVLQFWIRRPLY